jgi:hypothetical protein
MATQMTDAAREEKNRKERERRARAKAEAQATAPVETTPEPEAPTIETVADQILNSDNILQAAIDVMESTSPYTVKLYRRDSDTLDPVLVKTYFYGTLKQAMRTVKAKGMEFIVEVYEKGTLIDI